jgi:hypothetical protein
MTFYFVVRTDVASDDGQQRVFDCCDTEDDAAESALRIAARHYGAFAVVGPAPIALNIVREGGAQPVRVEPATPTE